MIRTTLSFLLLFAVLALVSRAVFRTDWSVPSDSPALQIQGADGSEDPVADPPLPDPPVLEPALRPKLDRIETETRQGESTRRVAGSVSDDKEQEPVVVAGDEPDDGEVEDETENEPAAKVADAEPPVTYRLQAIDEDKDFSPEMISRRERIRDTLAYYFVRPEDAAKRSPWGVMHAIIAYGVDTPLTVGGEEMNAVGWLCWNRPCRGMRLFRAPDGEIKTPIGPGFQGHEGQFLAMMAQSKIQRDYPMRIDGYRFTIDDLVDYEKRTCRPKSELTFKLIGLVHYLDSDEQWVSETGQKWSIPRLIKEELAQPVIGAACGGTHRMMGFSYAVHKRRQRKEPFTGEWERARKFVNSYIQYTFKLQNRDGSFSTDWFRGRGNRGDIDRKIQTTGHMLEWLVFSLPEEDLTDPRVVRSVDFIVNALWNNRGRDLEVGPKGHALRALALYDERVFGGKPGTRKDYLAERAGKLRR